MNVYVFSMRLCSPGCSLDQHASGFAPAVGQSSPLPGRPTNPDTFALAQQDGVGKNSHMDAAAPNLQDRLAWYATFAALYAFETDLGWRVSMDAARRAYEEEGALSPMEAVRTTLRGALTWPARGDSQRERWALD